MNGNPPLLYISVPDDCQEVVPLLDSHLPHFAKLLKRVFKKIKKGISTIERPIYCVSSDGQLEPSDFLLVSEPDNSNPGFLFADLSSSETSDDTLYKLPVTRFTVRRKTDNQSSPLQKPTLNNIELTLKQFSDRLAHIGSSLDALSTNKKPVTNRKPTPATKRVPFEEPTVSVSTPVAGPKKPKPRNSTPRPPPNPEFVEHLDRTITKVLHRIKKNKPIGSLDDLERRMCETSQEVIESSMADLDESQSIPEPSFMAGKKKKKLYPSNPVDIDDM